MTGSRFVDRSIIGMTGISSISSPGVVLASKGSATGVNTGSTGFAGIVVVGAGVAGGGDVTGTVAGDSVKSLVEVASLEVLETVTGSFPLQADIIKAHAQSSNHRSTLEVGTKAGKWGRLHASMDSKVDAF